ncbi:MAG TPA: hypothetical protein VJ866_01650, partial [Pyrinomonadaceae bacterium]|nr:hypothetical protein [Pyrinomonadaceae bacterium]
TEQLRYLKRFVLWYIEHRQIENGEFGGGLSDDGDLTNWWPATALMGAEPEKIKESLLREMDAFYAEGMFTNGLSTIQADELHSYEEGIQVLGQSLLLDYGDPVQLERAMETSRALLKLTGVNAAGHRHIRSSYYSGSKMATEEPWGWSKPSSILVLHPALMLVQFNGNPEMKRVVTELADGFLAHRHKGEDGRYRLNAAIRFEDDKDLPWLRGSVLPVFWAAWKWTGDAKYLQPFKDEGPRSLDSMTADALDLLNLRDEWGKETIAAAQPGATSRRPTLPPPNAAGTNTARAPITPPPNYAAMHFAWQLTGEKRYLETLYAAQMEASAIREYMNTEGSMWIDRVEVPYAELQRARLGGVALTRNSLFPGNAVSWKFARPGDEEKVAILIPKATPDALKIVVYNMSDESVTADMVAWDLEPGRWQISQSAGLDDDNQDRGGSEVLSQTKDLERGATAPLIFSPHATTVFELKLVERGMPYWSRPDLGVGRGDVSVSGRKVTVTVHSLGAVDTRPATLSLVDATGKVLSTVAVPALKAPTDLLPKTVTLTFDAPSGARLVGASVRINADATTKEITLVNNSVKL